MNELKAHRDAALSAWEKAIAATVVHYINDVIGDMEAEDYSFYDHAKHWSEMKGFALSFQFNRRSPPIKRRLWTRPCNYGHGSRVEPR